MVTKTVAAQPVAFPDVPPREDMQNSRQLYMPARLPALRGRLRELEDRKPPDQRRSVFVYSEIHVRPIPVEDHTRLFVPDMTVAFRRRRRDHRTRQRLRDRASAQAAEAEREEERQGRLAESARADAAEIRARQLEEKLRRLQG